MKAKTVNESYKIKAPKIGEIIDVYHPKFGGVEMTVIDEPYNNIIPCDYRGIEVSVRLGKIIVNGEIDYRWEAEEL